MFFPSVHARWRFYCARAFFLAIFLPASALCQTPPAALTHQEAMRRVLEANPELQVFNWRQQVLRGELLSAGQSAGYQLELDAENIRGSSEDLEVTLAMSSVIELGNKRGARTSVAESRLTLAESERQAAALDLLGRATQRFIGVLSLQEKLKVVGDATELAQESLGLVRQRFERGAAPEAEVLRAEAALAQAQLRQQAMVAQLASNKIALASHWGAPEADFTGVAGKLFHFLHLAGFDDLYRRATAAPGIQTFADEARVRQAEVELAMARSRADIQWRAGIRQFVGADETALVAGFSMPLSAAKRARGEQQSARAERQLVDSRREAALLTLRSSLFDAWQTRQQSVDHVQQLNQRVLPALARAVELTRQSYERGRYSYIEWAGVQQDFLAAKLALIDAATEAHLQQALIEQLTAEPLIAPSFSELNRTEK